MSISHANINEKKEKEKKTKNESKIKNQIKNMEEIKKKISWILKWWTRKRLFKKLQNY